MSKKKIAFVAAGTMFALIASPAGATILSETVSGVVGGLDTVDTFGFFGTPGADLTGEAVSASF